MVQTNAVQTNLGTLRAAASQREKLPVTALITAYYHVSHADVIVSKILEGYQRNGESPGPGLRLVSMFVDQPQHVHDISRALAKKYDVRLCQSVEEAITLGTDQVQVAGVLSIGEHGEYPRVKETQQKMYPRRRFFDETVATYRRCGRSVPFFNDKHLSYRWEDAVEMVKTARKMKFPLLAGSSLPLTWRFPALELPPDCEIESALTIGYGPLEDYGFHALEAHQGMIERRRGGEAGVRSVRVAVKDQIRESEREGHWSAELFSAARRSMPRAPEDAAAWDPLRAEFEGNLNQPAAYLLEHEDGLKSAVIMTAGWSGGFAFACRLKGEDRPRACWFKLQDWGPFGHFSYLLEAFEATIRSGETVYPVERTLLTTGTLDRCMQGLAAGGARQRTPELAVTYSPGDWPFANHVRSKLSLPHE
ncbi:MAG: hypothetical protein FJ295_02070 [Planctomycetes bacterium]|nr:hypothetical protein [Planctomycetota bacterium]